MTKLPFKILGQDPAAILAVVQAGLAMLLGFGLFGLDSTKNGVIMAAITAAFGLVGAYVTRTTAYTAAVGFAQAILVLGVTFGLNVSDIEQSSILAFVSVALGLFLHQTTVTEETAISSKSPGAVKQDLELLALTAPPAPVAVVDVTNVPGAREAVVGLNTVT